MHDSKKVSIVSQEIARVLNCSVVIFHSDKCNQNHEDLWGVDMSLGVVFHEESNSGASKAVYDTSFCFYLQKFLQLYQIWYRH